MKTMVIDHWDHGEKFFLVQGNITEEHNDILVRTFNQKLLISVEGKQKEYVFSGEWNDFQCGDIVSVSRTGKVQCQYKNGHAEVDLFFTNKCNSNCVMCPLAETVRKKNNPELGDWIKKFIRILPQNVPFINITGGEPTLNREDFLCITKMLREKFQYTEFQLLTNGRTFSDMKFLGEALASMPNNVRFSIPLHSGIEAIHDAITRAEGSFRQTDRAIRNLIHLRQKVEIRIVVSRLNIDSIDETIDYIIKNYPGVFVVNFIAMEMMGNAAKNRKVLWVDYDKAFSKIKKSIVRLIKSGIDTQLYCFPLCTVDKGFWTIAVKSITDYKRSYKEDCRLCDVRPICGGYFNSTMNLMNPEVRPIHAYAN